MTDGKDSRPGKRVLPQGNPFPWIAGLLLSTWILAQLVLPGVSAAREPSPFLLDRALEAVALTRSDLSIRSELLDSPHASPLFHRWMSAPLLSPSEGKDLAVHLLSLADRPPQWVEALSSLSGDEPPAFVRTPPSRIWDLPRDLAPPVREAVQRVLDGMQQAESILEETFQPLSPKERTLLAEHLYPEALGTAGDEASLEKLLAKEAVQDALDAASAMDRTLILQAGRIVVEAAWLAADTLLEHPDQVLASAPVTFTTPLGVVRIGGPGHDTHSGPAVLILDPGGCDTYTGEVACGRKGSCGVVIDLAGNDTYLGEDVTQGAGELGVGVLLDFQGNDLYQAGNGAQGMGIFGFGLLWDAGGDDLYRGRRFVQAASCWGYGGLIDLEGGDTYVCDSGGQAGAWLPGAAALCDRCGDDRYLAGRNALDRREPDMHQSFAQGFAMGLRNRCAGGTALLADGAGNDLYQGQYFAQGSAYGQAVGMLFDGRGRDTYVARRYAQGAGVHSAFGLLLDLRGDDHTASWGVSQGCGHDWGVGVLVNGEGKDTYVGDWLCLGASEANGLGLFFDHHGNDGYETRAGAGTGRLVPERRSGGLGLFLDADGDDRYSERGANHLTWSSNRWAVGADAALEGRSGLDLEVGESLPFPCDTGVEAQREKERKGLETLLEQSESLPASRRAEALLAVSAHWGLERDVPRVARDRLLALDGAASVPALTALLDSPDILRLRRMEEVFRIHAFHALPLLLQRAKEDDPLVASRALFMLSRLRDTRALAVCLDALDRKSPRVRAAALRALGDMLARDRLPALNSLQKALNRAHAQGLAAPVLTYLEHRPAALKQSLSVAVRAFSVDGSTYDHYADLDPQNASSRELEAFAAFLFEHERALRTLLAQWLSALNAPGTALARMTALLQDREPAVRAHAVYALGQAGEVGVLPRLVDALQDPHALVRDAAVLAVALFGNAAVDALSRHLDTGDTPMRILALDALGRINTLRSRTIIAQWLQTSDPAVRQAAERALGLPW